MAPRVAMVSATGHNGGPFALSVWPLNGPFGNTTNVPISHYKISVSRTWPTVGRARTGVQTFGDAVVTGSFVASRGSGRKNLRSRPEPGDAGCRARGFAFWPLSPARVTGCGNRQGSDAKMFVSPTGGTKSESLSEIFAVELSMQIRFRERNYAGRPTPVGLPGARGLPCVASGRTACHYHGRRAPGGTFGVVRGPCLRAELPDRSLCAAAASSSASQCDAGAGGGARVRADASAVHTCPIARFAYGHSVY